MNKVTRVDVPSNGRRPLTWIVTLPVLAALGTLVLYLSVFHDTPKSEVIPDPEDILRTQLIAQISNYDSPSSDVDGQSVAAPLPTPAARREPQAATAPELPTTNLNVVSVEEPMQIELGPANRNHTKTYEREYLAWLHSPNVVDKVLEQAELIPHNRSWIYGWVQLEQPVTDPLLAQELAQLDTTVIGRVGDMVRVRLPNDRNQLESLQDHTLISGLGVLPATEKIAEELVEEFSISTTSEHPIYITVMSTQAIDEYRRTLQQIGVRTGHFFDDIRVFAAVASDRLIELVARLDFVQAIEPIGIVQTKLDTAVPAVGADAIRGLGHSVGEFSGFSGKSVPIAVIDTGLNTSHVDISSFRQSICGKNFVPGEDSDLWYDANQHGSHVTGIVVGQGFYQPVHAGIAPGTENIRFAKALSTFGIGFNLWVIKGMEFFSEESSCESEGWSDEELKPLIVNLSLSADSAYWNGKDTIARKLDSMVWSHHQLYVAAASNSGISQYGDVAAAKNSLAVGAAYDSGDITWYSSKGPTYDGRLFPNLSGPGDDVLSAKGRGQHEGYNSLGGTSMSSPAVAGIATLLMDAAPDHKENPALTRARLMASAIKPDLWLNSSGLFPRDNTNGSGFFNEAYGLGVASARTSILNEDVAEGWTSSATTVDDLEHDEVAYHDIEIPPGASRLDVVLTWDEPSAETIAETVLNDFDLYVDQDANCGSDPCGEHSSLSTIDNVEWVIINDPEPGTYRLKVHGARVFTKSRAAVAWTVIRGASTPQLTIEAAQESYTSTTGSAHSHTVELTVSTSGYVALGTELYIDCRTQDNLPCESFGHVEYDDRYFQGTVAREDELMLEFSQTPAFNLGEVSFNEAQTVTIHLYSKSEESLIVNFTASSWNANAGYTSVKFVMEGTDAADLVLPEQPENDNLDSPTVLAGDEGVLEIDTLLASTEGGEAGLQVNETRTRRSLWYSWTTERTDLASFIASPIGQHSFWYVGRYRPRVEVYEVASDGEGLGAIKRLGRSLWSVQWFPKAGVEYRIRVTQPHATLPLRLNWYTGKVAVNDHFADATVIEGESGTIDGHNLGATLEPGENYGYLAASVWYRWDAPVDGVWDFHIRDAQLVHLLVFTGTEVGNLRLVSGFHGAGEIVPVPVAAGETYYLMVASPNTHAGGWIFEDLNWQESQGIRQEDDFMAHATILDSSENGRVQLPIEKGFTVEPNEPQASGIQTGWLKWTAPNDGQFTWYWQNSDYDFEIYQGDNLENLKVLEKSPQEFSNDEFVVEVSKDEEYILSAGASLKNNRAFSVWPSPVWQALEWGQTPENNSVTQALAITASEGSIEGYTHYATTEPNDFPGLGSSSLWYSYEAEEAGWYKFHLSSGGSQYLLAAFARDVNSSELELVNTSVTSTALGEGVSVIVYLAQGDSILLRVAHQNRHRNSYFTLAWEPTEPPQWLRYLGRVANGLRDEAGNLISLQNPGDMVFDPTGQWLFVSTEAGIHLFERDAESGYLSFVKELVDVPASAYLTWDSHRDRLYATERWNWWVFKPETADDLSTLELEFMDEIDESYSEDFDGGPVLFMGQNGDYLYKIKNFSHVLYGFSESGKIEENSSEYSELTRVGPHSRGDHWLGSRWDVYYALFRRELGTGMFRRVSETRPHLDTIPITLDSEYFFTVGSYAYPNASVRVHSADIDNSAVEQLQSSTFYDFGFQLCESLIPRPGVVVGDVFCNGGIFVVEYDVEADEIKLRDLIINSPQTRRTVPDRFGRLPPKFTIRPSVPVEESPDRKHIYVSTDDTGIFIFERIGIDPVEVPTNPNLIARLDRLQIADNTVEFGDESVEDGCLTVTNVTIDNVSYTIEDSKWQERDLGGTWSDVNGSEDSNQVCSRELSETKEYRVVATVSVDGSAKEYASNSIGKVFYSRLAELDVKSGEVELDALTITECTKVSNTTLSGTKYTVETSQWQVRQDSSAEWRDIELTKTSRQLCPRSPDDDREYRLVGTFLIDDERGYYRSNTITGDD